jgi:hypothetical protein
MNSVALDVGRISFYCNNRQRRWCAPSGGKKRSRWCARKPHLMPTIPWRRNTSDPAKMAARVHICDIKNLALKVTLKGILPRGLSSDSATHSGGCCRPGRSHSWRCRRNETVRQHHNSRWLANIILGDEG